MGVCERERDRALNLRYWFSESFLHQTAKKMAKDGNKGGWKEFIWNPRTRELFGRTASSWGKTRNLSTQESPTLINTFSA